MPVIRHHNPATSRSALVLDLGDLKRQAEAVADAMRAQADDIIAKAQAERERLLSGAAEEGRAAGHAQGLAAGLAEGREAGRAEALEQTRTLVDALAMAWSGSLAAFEKLRDGLLCESRADLVRLSVAIAERVTKRTIDADPRVVEGQLEAALRFVTGPTRLVIRVHPEDLASAESVLPELIRRLGESCHTRIVAEGGLARGSVVVDTDKGRVDASIDGQLDRLVEALLPGVLRGLEMETVEASTAAAPMDDAVEGGIPGDDGGEGGGDVGEPRP